jgi:hypothetical protein
MSDEKGPIKLEMITGLTAAWLDNPDVGPPSIRPIVTLNLVDQSGRVVLLPLSDTALPKILDTLQRIVQGIDGLPGSKPFVPPKMQ